MKYLLMICGGERREPGAGRIGIEEWVLDADERRQRLFGRALDPPETTTTVRVRDGELRVSEGETIASDGPFTEGREFIAGFDVVDCADLDEAVELAGRHPVAGSGAVEIRPFLFDFTLTDAGRAWAAAEPSDSWVLFPCVDGIPAADDVEAEIGRDARAWGQRLEDDGVMVFGQPLREAATATTVRAYETDTVVSDGPFVETREFIAGACVLHGVDRDRAVQLAAEHPIAVHHRVEVRRFLDW